MSGICAYCGNEICILNHWKHQFGKEDGSYPTVRKCDDFYYRLPVETDIQKRLYAVFIERTGYKEPF